MYVVLVEPVFSMYRFLEVARRRYSTIVLSRDPDKSREEERRFLTSMGKDPGATGIDVAIQCDARTSEGLLRAIDRYRSEVAGIIACDEPVVSAVLGAARALGLDAATEEDARCQHIKSRMKQRLQECGVRTARFVVAKDYETAYKAWKSFGGDCMVKRVDFRSSVGVYRASTAEALRVAWGSLEESRPESGPTFPWSGEVVLEEVIEGKELSAEGYVQGDRIVVLSSCGKVTERNFQVVGHHVPAVATEAELAAVRQIATECVRALRIRNSIFHLEVHIRDSVPYIIECASRAPGHYVGDLLRQSYGFDLVEISIDLATGRPVAVVPTEPKKFFGIFVLYSSSTGVLKEIRGLDRLRSMPELKQLVVEVQPGARVRAMASPEDRYGLVVLEARSAEQVKELENWLRSEVRFIAE